jgi:hypothetical protein|tara:strand:+ start:1598 stop:1987 length:390 start_codon:yes stop_codon:yes gene_type:complete
MSLLSSLIQPVSKLLDKAIPDTDLKRKLSHEIATIAEKQAHELAMAQVNVNKEEAKGNWFQSSWRPLIGWICGISLAINYMVSPICAGFGIAIPQADMTVMMPLLLGMLGLAGMRSVDKFNKTDTKGSK